MTLIAAGNGTRYRVLVRSADTAGASFTVEVLSRAGIPGFLPDQSGSSPAHSHTAGQEEEVTVIKGKLGYLLGGSDANGELEAGQTFTIPAGKSSTGSPPPPYHPLALLRKDNVKQLGPGDSPGRPARHQPAG